MKIQASSHLVSITPLFVLLVVTLSDPDGVSAIERGARGSLRASVASSVELDNPKLDVVLWSSEMGHQKVATIDAEQPVGSNCGPIIAALDDDHHPHARNHGAKNDDSRNLDENQIADWVCVRPASSSNHYGTVRIWWGFQPSDATWACNEWNPQCEGQCSAQSIKTSVWNCYKQDPIQHKETVEIWWGHTGADGGWACNEWKPDCEAGKCFATPVYYIDNENNRRWSSSGNTCSGNGGSCNAVSTAEYSITLATFKNDDTWDQVMGCGGSFALTGTKVNSDGVEVQFGTTRTYQEWEGCCAVVGDTLQQRGLLSDGWKCAKNADFGAVRIDLLGKNACWGTNTRCLGGTTCNYCCRGYSWRTEWFGHQCD